MENNKKIFNRYTALTIILLILFSLISFRLVDIQIVQGDDLRREAQDKSIRTVDDEAPRGEILDRNGLKLAANVQSYIVYMMKPQDDSEKAEEKLMEVIERLVEILNKNHEKINDEFNIVINQQSDGKNSFEFQFSSNDEKLKKNQENRWKEDNGILKEDKKTVDDSATAEQVFYKLKEKYKINPVGKDHANDITFIRQMMVIRQMIKDKGYMAYKPVEIAYVSKETAFEIMEKALYLPGVDTKIKPLRTYPNKDIGSLIIGSLRKILDTKVRDYLDKQYDPSVDLIGRDGIEAYAEEDLRGEKGGRTVKVDAYGRIVEELGKRAPVPGNNIILTIDENLQAMTEKALDDVMEKLRKGTLSPSIKKTYPNATRGAAVVIDVKTGEVLAMASRPGGYDPNIMAATGSFSEEVRKVLMPTNEEHKGQDKERILKPMFNYATSGAVPSGSTFKMVTAVAGLETGAISPSTSIRDVGVYSVVEGFHGACWKWNMYRGSHGWLTVKEALKVSCNYFFFEVGHRIGADNLTKYAKYFGLTNDPTGIEINESPGNVANREEIKQVAEALVTRKLFDDLSRPGFDKKNGPIELTDDQKNLITNMIRNNDRDVSKLKTAGISSSYARSRIIQAVKDVYNEYNRPGIVLNAAIGQGEDRFTPLQIANYIATIANKGVRLRPHLVKKIVKSDGTVVKEIEPEVMAKLNLKSSTLPTVIAGMDAVTTEGGTAGLIFRGMKVKTAGKTGTAQASGNRAEYSWFAGFAPADDPQIAIAVVIYEGGGNGTSNVARAIIENYLK